MHEFALAQYLLGLALQKADSKRILRLHLRIGPFLEDQEESIRFFWRDLAKGSLGEGAELHFEHFSSELKCLDCNGTFYLDEEGSMCDYCFNVSLQRASGDDVQIERIDLE